MQRRALLVAITLGVVLSACASPPQTAIPPRQVLFVCEHGNVKSLMAASYFNELAQARGLPFRAVSRGLAPDSDTVPDFVKEPLMAEGFDVRGFRPQRMSEEDIVASDRVIGISTTLPVEATSAAAQTEQWNDVPAASTDYARSRDSIKAHVEDLLERLARP